MAGDGGYDFHFEEIGKRYNNGWLILLLCKGNDISFFTTFVPYISNLKK